MLWHNSIIEDEFFHWFNLFFSNMVLLNNMRSITSSHNKHILNSSSIEYGCICNNRVECSLENKCFTPRIVYRADVRMM